MTVRLREGKLTVTTSDHAAADRPAGEDVGGVVRRTGSAGGDAAGPADGDVAGPAGADDAVSAGGDAGRVARPTGATREDVGRPGGAAVWAGRLREDAAAERVCAALRSPLEPLLRDPDGLRRDLAVLLNDAAAGVPGDDLGLRVVDPELGALPWELAAPALEAAGLRLFRRAPRTRGEPADVRAVQGALNRLGRGPLAGDGDLGPVTRAALAALQAELGLPATGLPDPVSMQRLHSAVAGGARPLVAVLRAARPRVTPDDGADTKADVRSVEEASERPGVRTAGFDARAGTPVDRTYARAGFRTVVLDAPGELKSLPHEFPAAVIHLDAGFAVHHGVPALDLRGRGRLTATALDRLIPRDVPAPLVVLDPPAPRTAHETAVELLLRNSFAAELAAVSGVRAVLAAGLVHGGRRERQRVALAGALREGRDVHDVARALREPALDDTLGFVAAALFARTPSVRFPAPG